MGGLHAIATWQAIVICMPLELARQMEQHAEAKYLGGLHVTRICQMNDTQRLIKASSEKWILGACIECYKDLPNVQHAETCHGNS